jgi:DNA repair protein RadD
VIREPEQEEKKEAKVSRAAILSTQQPSTVVWHDITRVAYSVHSKPGKPDSLRVDYWSGLRCVASEWVCFEHQGYAQQKAHKWWRERWSPCCRGEDVPATSEEALEVWYRSDCNGRENEYGKDDPDGFMLEPNRIATRQNGKFTEVLQYEFDSTQNHKRSPEKVAA